MSCSRQTRTKDDGSFAVQDASGDSSSRTVSLITSLDGGAGSPTLRAANAASSVDHAAPLIWVLLVLFFETCAVCTIFYGIMLIGGEFSARSSARDLWVFYGADLIKFRGKKWTFHAKCTSQTRQHWCTQCTIPNRTYSVRSMSAHNRFSCRATWTRRKSHLATTAPKAPMNGRVLHGPMTLVQRCAQNGKAVGGL